MERVAFKALTSVWARLQEPALTAEEIAFSWEAMVALWSPVSSPLLLPQATTKAAANPSPPARNAREPNPMCRLTLEAVAVAFTLGRHLVYCPYCRRSASESGSRAARIAAAAPAMS